MSKKKILARVAFILVVSATLVGVIYIMINQLGLNPDLDFGAGSYYYADIPDYEKTLDWDTYTAKLPGWVYYVLFFAWGGIAWLIWKWVEKKK